MRRVHGLSLGIIVGLAGCSAGGNVAPLTSQATVNPLARGASHGVLGPRGSNIRVFIHGTSKRYNPDPIVSQGRYFYVAFQNATNPDGTGGKSTIVQYTNDGEAVQSVAVPGRCDGMRWNPYTNLMWLTVNEDAHSSMYTWDPGSHWVKHYAFSSARHGGGYDDLAFSNGAAFVAASNPKLSPSGISTGPAVVGVSLNGRTAQVTPVLMGNAMAQDIPTGQTVQLNLTDPDSMSVAPNGDVLLISQADSEIVFLHNAGQGSQSVSRVIAGTQLDDTMYDTASRGSLYVGDSKKNVIYQITGKLQSGALYTEAPSDSKVAGFVDTVDPLTGIVTPIYTGFDNPTGLLFVASGGR